MRANRTIARWDRECVGDLDHPPWPALPYRIARQRGGDRALSVRSGKSRTVRLRVDGEAWSTRALRGGSNTFASTRDATVDDQPLTWRVRDRHTTMTMLAMRFIAGETVAHQPGPALPARRDLVETLQRTLPRRPRRKDAPVDRANERHERMQRSEAHASLKSIPFTQQPCHLRNNHATYATTMPPTQQPCQLCDNHAPTQQPCHLRNNDATGATTMPTNSILPH